MATLKDYRDERLKKLEALKALGVDPYPAQSHRTYLTKDALNRYDELAGQTVTVAGRIDSIRSFGKLVFIKLRDISGTIQLYLQADNVAPLDAGRGVLGMKELKLLDSGDFIEATGEMTTTQTGEKSVGVRELRLLTKSLRPMPEKLESKEERFRRRYVDMNVNQNVRDRFMRRSKFWQATRKFLDDRGFVEINIPVLEHTTGGADANPFVTHMDALDDQQFYLRISHELPLKRLLGAGFEKVYDLGPRFRNENYSDEHLPEHIAMEWYWAYADWQEGIQFQEDFFKFILHETFGTLQFRLGKFDVNLEGDWERWDYAETIQKRYGIDPFNCTLDEVKAALKANNLEIEQSENKSRGIDKLWKNIRKDVAGPIWLINTPTFISPLSKANPDRPETTQRAQVVIAGSELCNLFSELNDPQDQLARFVEQQSMRDAGDDEAMMLDIDYVEMLEYGMPPACGLGFSERVFWIFEGVTAREGVPFPQLKSDIDETTKSIYSEISFEVSKASKTTSVKDVPVSAAEEGTYKLYLEDYKLLECDATVQSAERLDDTTYRVVLDKSCVYPGGGGQAFDLGTVSWDGGSLVLKEVGKDAQGVIYHDGVLVGVAPVAGQAVHCKVDAERRLLNSRLHCVGHLIDYAIKQTGKSWKPGRGAHFPDMSFVEYDGDFAPEEAPELIAQIESCLQALAAQGGAIGTKQVPSAEARHYSEYIPEAVLSKYQNIQLATYPNEFYICCGGTHLSDVSQIGGIKITKIKRKDGKIRVSYELAD